MNAFTVQIVKVSPCAPPELYRHPQTRETTVHRFVVESSVEENVHQLCSARAAAMDLSAAGVGKRSKGEEKMLSVRCAAVKRGGASVLVPVCRDQQTS